MLAPIFNNNFNNNYKKQINRFRPSFGYRLSGKIYTDIRDIPHLKCGCCGDDTFTSDGIKKFLDTFAADSRSVLKNRVLDRFRDTEAFKFIQALSDEQPKKTVREILNSGEGQEKIRALDPRMQLAIMQIGIYTDGISVTAPKVIKKLQKYYSNFGRDLQEIFHLMEFYSIKYADKTFAEIFREPDVANYHAKVFELTANDASARKINIFKQLRDLSSTLSVKDKKLLQKTNTDAMVILNNGLYQSHINKALIEDMYAKFADECSDKTAGAKIMEIIQDLPFQTSSPDRFITSCVRERKSDMSIIEMFVREMQATYEHFKAKSMGGQDEQDNIIVLCKKCNNERSNLPYPFFLRFHPEMKINLQKQIDKIMTFIMHGRLKDYDNYPIGIRDNVKSNTDNEIILNINKYLKFREEKAEKSLESSKALLARDEALYQEAQQRIREIDAQLETLMSELRVLKKQKRNAEDEFAVITAARDASKSLVDEQTSILDKIKQIVSKNS